MTQFFVFLLVVVMFLKLIRSEELFLKSLHSKLGVEQFENLSDDICRYSSIFENEIDQESCLKMFWRSPEDMEAGPIVQIRCQTEESVIIEVPESSDDQIVMLVPANDNSSVIEYKIFRANENYLEIRTNNRTDLHIWSSRITPNMTLAPWRIGAKIDPVKTEKRNYSITIDGFTFESNSEYIGVNIKWNTSDQSDSCFHVRNHCQNLDLGEFYENTTTPNNNNHVEIRTGDKKLKLSDNCTFTVEGKHGTSTFNYLTPDCIEGTNVCVPESVKNISVKTHTSINGVGWDIDIDWDKPKNTPTGYNISLGVKYSNEKYYYSLMGNETHVTIQNVTGNETFYINVTTVTPLRSIMWMDSFPFSEEETSSTLSVMIAASWCMVFVIGFLATGLYVRRRTKNNFRNKYFQSLEEKYHKECLESFSQTPIYSDDVWEISLDRLTLHEVIGEGAFGVVKKGTLGPNAKVVAVKMLKELPSVEEVRSFLCEMELMKSVGAHPHIVSLVGCCTKRNLMIVSEYCCKGDLLNYLRCAWDVMVAKQNGKYSNNNTEPNTNYRNDLYNSSEEHNRLVVNKLYDLQKICDAELTSVDLLSFCRQIAMGMEYLASNRVVHRDLAARNILVTGDRTLKIADFGLSRDVYQENQYKQKGSGKLPVKWMAIESLTHRLYTTHSDVWSFGVVVWEIWSLGASPYSSVPMSRLLRLLKHGYRLPRPTQCPAALYEIMSECWSARPSARPSFAELVFRLDSLLSTAAEEYLTLHIEPTTAPPNSHKYFKMIPRSKRYLWKKEETYERPLKPSASNHYTSAPNTICRTQKLALID